MSKPRSLSDIVPKITKNIFGKKNLLFGKMLAQWVNIVGQDMSSKTTPLDIKYLRVKKGGNHAILHLGIKGAYATEVSMQKDLLKERLNMFFGYPAIKDIKIIQYSEVMDKKIDETFRLNDISKKEIKAINEIIGEFEENDLKIALRNLGKAIVSRQSKHK